MFEGVKTAIIGTVGVPGKYGGFETLAENLVRFASERRKPPCLTIYCSANAYEQRPDTYMGAHLTYLPVSANGPQSIIYDILSMLSAVRSGHEQLLVLGVSGCIALPLLRRFSRVRILTNIDGIEWRREKWNAAARWFLRFSERLAVRYSHVVIADNQAIVDYVFENYGQKCELIAYGGDHALATSPGDIGDLGLPRRYALGLCRIVRENNVEMILEAFRRVPTEPLVFVGNWAASDYGRELRSKYDGVPNLYLLDAIYDPGQLRAVRDGASLYIHGHSAGGTNPSLVEMMYFGLPIIAFDCSFNRYTTEERARYFSDAAELHALLEDREGLQLFVNDGHHMAEIASNRYTWRSVGTAYFKLLGY